MSIFKMDAVPDGLYLFGVAVSLLFLIELYGLFKEARRKPDDLEELKQRLKTWKK